MKTWRDIEANLVLICRELGIKVVRLEGVPWIADSYGSCLANLEQMARRLAGEVQ